MKEVIEISNDFSIPLTAHDVEWNLYVYKKRYKTKNKIKTLDAYDMYKIDTISLDTLYSDIHNYILKKYINKLDICEYSAEIPKNKIGFIDLEKNDNILKNGLSLLNECIVNYTQFAGKDLSLHGYVLECNIDGSTYMQVISSTNPIKFYKHNYSFLFR